MKRGIVPGEDPALEQSPPNEGKDAFAGSLSRFLPSLRRFVARHFPRQFGRRESPTDIVQSACREALDDLSSFDDGEQGEVAFRNWLFVTTRRKMLDRQRHHLRQRRSIAREDPCGQDEQRLHVSVTPSRAAVRAEEVQQLHDALAQLPERYRDLIRRIHIDGISAEEVARADGISRTAVHSRLARAMARLAGVLRSQQGDS